ncbi:unnamed protein product, partial [Didymodactylos carnosus]
LDINKATASGVNNRLLRESSAFDKVCEKGLLYKLRKKGVCAELVEWFEDYLLNRQITTVVDGKKSNPIRINCGIPQGSEHRINGKKFAGEVHFVHQNPLTNQSAVLCFFIVESEVEDTPWRIYVNKAITLNSTGYQTAFEGNLSALMYAHKNTFADFWRYDGRYVND